MGKLASVEATGLLKDVDKDLVKRTIAWYDRVIETDARFAVGSYCLVEVAQEVCMRNITHTYMLTSVEGGLCIL